MKAAPNALDVKRDGLEIRAKPVNLVNIERLVTPQMPAYSAQGDTLQYWKGVDHVTSVTLEHMVLHQAYAWNALQGSI